MQLFNKIFAAVALATMVSATPAPEVEERQLLGALPIPVCLTGDFLGGLPLIGSIVESLGSELLSCASGETCTALPLPLVGSLLPLGVSFIHIKLISEYETLTCCYHFRLTDLLLSRDVAMSFSFTVIKRATF